MAGPVVVLDITQEMLELLTVSLVRRIDGQIMNQGCDLVLFQLRRKYLDHPGEDFDGPVVVGAGVVEHEEHLVLSHHSDSFPAVVLPLQIDLGTGKRPLCNENRLAGYTRRLSGNTIQFYRLRPDKITQAASKRQDRFYNPVSDMRDDKQDKPDNQHPDAFRPGYDSEEQTGDSNQAEEARQDTGDHSGYAVQKDKDPLDQCHGGCHWQHSDLTDQFYYLPHYAFLQRREDRQARVRSHR